MHRLLAIACCLTLLLTAGVATAKDFKSNTAVESGYIWMFGYDTRASSMRMPPTLCYGGTLFQIIDFPWARNMVAEVNYLYTKIRGESFDWEGRDSNLFDLQWQNVAFNVGYMFEGRRLHPYLSMGPGVSIMHYEDRADERINELNFSFNLGGGVEYTLWETGMAALERVDLGVRLRYFYIDKKEMFNDGNSGVALTLRLNLRW